ncbi:MAG: glycosyltransferase [Fulvivirga sp.]
MLNTNDINFVTKSSLSAENSTVKIDVVTLIPHFNDIEGLKGAILSTKFSGTLEFVIVDDGSSSKPCIEYLKKLTSFNCHVIYLSENQGIELALNMGLLYILSKIRCKYIARMDCGDVSESSRLDTQIKFLAENQNIKLVGSWVDFIDENGTYLYSLKFPESHSDIVKRLPISVPFMHPSVVFDIEVLSKVKSYPTQYKAAEDYAFFYAVVKNFETANIPEVLIKVRLRQDGISLKNRRIQLKSRLRIILNNWEFNCRYISGVFRVLVLFFLPHAFTEKIKRRFWV